MKACLRFPGIAPTRSPIHRDEQIILHTLLDCKSRSRAQLRSLHIPLLLCRASFKALSSNRHSRGTREMGRFVNWYFVRYLVIRWYVREKNPQKSLTLRLLSSPLFGAARPFSYLTIFYSIWFDLIYRLIDWLIDIQHYWGKSCFVLYNGFANYPYLVLVSSMTPLITPVLINLALEAVK